jgi:hypothetical protein
MRSLKKTAVVAFVMIALLIPVLAICDNAAGEAELRTDSVWVSGGFNDRTDGTITVRVFNINAGDELTVTINNIFTGNMFGGATRTIVATDADESRGFVDIGVSFRIGDPGKYFASIVVTGDNVSETRNEINTFNFEVGRSIWSSIWTYVAIIVVIIIIGIVLLLRMRAAPKVEHSGAFTAMEEERQVKRKSSSAKKEEYKGRSKK